MGFRDMLRFILVSTCELTGNMFNIRRKYTGNTDINGKVVVITGANTGIGKVTAKELARRGAKVIIGCRDVDKGQKAIDEIRQEFPNAELRVVKLDLSSLESVRQFAQQVSQQEPQIDILINNAGVMMCPKWKTEDGFEMQFGTNHLGHFLLTMLLLDRIKVAPKARIVTVSSTGHMPGVINFDDINLDNNYTPNKAYSQSKLANVLFSRELSKRLEGTNISTYSLHPGAVRTELQRHVGMTGCMGRCFQSVFLISPELGAQTTLYCALDESVDNESGHYYRNCRRITKNTSNVTDESAKKLWDLSCELVKLDEGLRLN